VIIIVLIQPLADIRNRASISISLSLSRIHETQQTQFL